MERIENLNRCRNIDITGRILLQDAACFFISTGRLTDLEMSVFELLATAREIQGVDYMKGDRILCEKRYAGDTEHMLEFQILKGQEPYGKAGDYCRLFLTGEAYCRMREKELQEQIRVIRYARVRDHALVYGPAAGRPASGRE